MTDMRLLAMRLTVGLLVFCPPLLYAADAQKRLQMNLEALRSFSADFSQRVIGIDRSKAEPSSGSVSFKRPGKFIWSYHKPYEQTIVSDGKQLWIYDKDLEQVTIRAVANEPAQAPIKILDNSVDIGEHYKIELLSSRGEEVEIQLTPKNEEAGFNYAILIFNKKGLVGMDIHDNFDYYSSLSFDNIVRQAVFDDAQFTFVAPPGVDVINATE